MASFSGADFGQKLTACMAALPASGGICDASSTTGNQSLSADLILNKSNTEIILGNMTVAQGTHQVLIPAGVTGLKIRGLTAWAGNNNALAAAGAYFTYSGTDYAWKQVGDTGCNGLGGSDVPSTLWTRYLAFNDFGIQASNAAAAGGLYVGPCTEQVDVTRLRIRLLDANTVGASLVADTGSNAANYSAFLRVVDPEFGGGKNGIRMTGAGGWSQSKLDGGRVMANGRHWSASTLARINRHTFGSGYQASDVVTVSGGTGGTISVDAVDGGGAVTLLHALTPGSGYSIGTNVATAGGHGTGFTVDLLSVGELNYLVAWGGSLPLNSSVCVEQGRDVGAGETTGGGYMSVNGDVENCDVGLHLSGSNGFHPQVWADGCCTIVSVLLDGTHARENTIFAPNRSAEINGAAHNRVIAADSSFFLSPGSAATTFESVDGVSDYTLSLGSGYLSETPKSTTINFMDASAASGGANKTYWQVFKDPTHNFQVYNRATNKGRMVLNQDGTDTFDTEGNKPFVFNYGNLQTSDFIWSCGQTVANGCARIRGTDGAAFLASVITSGLIAIDPGADADANMILRGGATVDKAAYFSYRDHANVEKWISGETAGLDFSIGAGAGGTGGLLQMKATGGVALNTKSNQALNINYNSGSASTMSVCDGTTNCPLRIAPTGVVTSTVTTGTAPFVIASTTVVTNLNADLLDGHHASDFSTTSGTVTAISVASANGVSGASSGGATPVLTFTLGDITPSSVSTSGTTPGKSSLVAGTGNVPALPDNSAGFVAPTTGGTAYLIKLPPAITAGFLKVAAPASSDGVNEAALSSGGITNADVGGLGGAAVLSVGTTAGTVAAGDDSRFAVPIWFGVQQGTDITNVRYIGVSNLAYTSTTAARFPIMRAGTIKTCSVQPSAALTGTMTLTWVLQKTPANSTTAADCGSPSTVTLLMNASSGGNEVIDSTNACTVAAGDMVDFKVTPTNSASAQYVTVGCLLK